jgi:Domain of unknown function (DUF4395)
MRMVRFSGSGGRLGRRAARLWPPAGEPMTGRPGRRLARQVFSFPNPVNEISARIVAGGVVLLAGATIAFDQPWLTIPLAYGFVARVLTGPTLSPLGQLSVRVITPLLGAPPRPVPGPPKRFAQGMGLVFSATAAVLALGFGERGAAYIVLGLLILAAILESVFAICLGCKTFALLMRKGFIPESVCEACLDISLRTGSSSPHPASVS